ncbi:hypothetical protein AAGG52_22965 [Bacillus licheniformis]
MRKLAKIESEEAVLRAIELSEYAFQRKLSAAELEKAKMKYQNHEVIGIKEGKSFCQS